MSSGCKPLPLEPEPVAAFAPQSGMASTIKPLYDTPENRSRYSVSTQGACTVVEELVKVGPSKFLLFLRFLSRIKHWGPPVLRFFYKLVSLSPYRVALQFFGGTIYRLKSLHDLYTLTEIGRLVQTAITKKTVPRRQLLKLLIAHLLVCRATVVFSHVLNSNDRILDNLCKTMVQEHILLARQRLDIYSQDYLPSVRQSFLRVEDLMYASSTQETGFAQDLLNMVGHLSRAVIDVSILLKTTNRKNIGFVVLAAVASTSNIDTSWLFGRKTRKRQRITNPAYQQATFLFDTLHRDRELRREIKIWGLSEVLIERYRQAAKAVREIAYPADIQGNYDVGGIWADSCRHILSVAYALHVSSNKGEPILFGLSDLNVWSTTTYSLLARIRNLAALCWSFQDHVESLRDYFELLEIPPLVREPVSPIPYEGTKQPGVTGMAVEFKDVTFGYPGNKPCLKGINFKVEPGQIVAIVGNNGAGKSSIVNILTRLFEVNSGQILINGVRIQDFNSAELQRHMAVLFQATNRMDVSIKDFIGMVDPARMDDQEAIERAAKAAGAHKVIMKQYAGYDSMLGPFPAPHTPESFFRNCMRRDYDAAAKQDTKLKQSKSEQIAADKQKLKTKALETETNLAKWEEPYPPLNFSGGEWQKIALARALFRQADLRIYDEYSGSLDPIAERKVFQNIWKIRESTKSTIIYVTQKFSSVPSADLILFVKDGVLVEKGTHEELIKNNGPYKEMFSAASCSFNDSVETYIEGDCGE